MAPMTIDPAWRYYLGHVTGAPDVLLRRKPTGETQRWLPADESWTDVPGNGLGHAIETGDLGYSEIDLHAASAFVSP